jgi:hypothetical protein
VLDAHPITLGAEVDICASQPCSFIAVMSRPWMIPWVRKLVAKIVELAVA